MKAEGRRQKDESKLGFILHPSAFILLTHEKESPDLRSRADRSALHAAAGGSDYDARAAVGRSRATNASAAAVWWNRSSVSRSSSLTGVSATSVYANRCGSRLMRL